MRSTIFGTMLLCGLWGTVFPVNALSINDKSSPHTSRRRAIAAVFGVTAVILSLPSEADASCIAGDTSVDCIGTFRTGIPSQRRSRSGDSYNDIRLRNYMLRPTRDVVVITTPNTLEEAIGILADQRLALDDMEQLVSAGNLEEAGVLWLGSLPKLTVAGRFVVWTVPAVTRIQPIFEQVEAAALALDKTIAKGIRGHSGVLAVAQLAVLKDLAQAKFLLDGFIKLAEIGQSLA